MLKNNEKDYKKEWHKWSKNSSKYNYEKNEKIWNELKKREDGITIKSLHWIVRENNLSEYNNIMEENKREKYKINQVNDVGKIVDEIKDKCDPRYTLKVKSIEERYNMELLVEFENTFCHWKTCDHDQGYTRIVIIKPGIAYLECTKCNKWYPPGGFIIQNVNQNIFNYNVTNNYYNNKDENKELDESILQGHKIFEDEELNKLMISSITGAHSRIAEVLYHLYKNEFNCTKYDVWYYYDYNRWNINGLKELKLKIIRGIAQKYKDLLIYVKGIKDPNLMDQLNSLIKHLYNLIKQIESNVLEDNIIKSASIIFYNNNKEFEEKLDKNQYLIGFKNGVYDLKNDIFRSGIPDDYITIL